MVQTREAANALIKELVDGLESATKDGARACHGIRQDSRLFCTLLKVCSTRLRQVLHLALECLCESLLHGALHNHVHPQALAQRTDGGFVWEKRGAVGAFRVSEGHLPKGNHLIAR